MKPQVIERVVGRGMLTWIQVLVAMLFVAGVARFGATSVDRACSDAGPPVARAEHSTARGAYCDALAHVSVRGVVFIVPVIAAALALLLLRRRPVGAIVAVALIIVATLLNAVVVESLEHALPLATLVASGS